MTFVRLVLKMHHTKVRKPENGIISDQPDHVHGCLSVHASNWKINTKVAKSETLLSTPVLSCHEINIYLDIHKNHF